MNMNPMSFFTRWFLIAAMGFVSFAVKVCAAPKGAHVPDELIVVLSTEAAGKDAATMRRELDEAEKLLPGNVEQSFRIGAKRLVKRIKLPPGLSVEQALTQRLAHPRIVSVEPNFILKGDATIPNDPRFNQ